MGTCLEIGMLEPPVLPSPDISRPACSSALPFTAQNFQEEAKSLLESMSVSGSDESGTLILPLLGQLAEALQVAVDAADSLHLVDMEVTIQLLGGLVSWLTSKFQMLRAVGPPLCQPLTSVVKGALALSHETLFNQHWLQELGSPKFLEASSMVRAAVKDLTILLISLLEDFYYDHLSGHGVDDEQSGQSAELIGARSLVDTLFTGLMLIGVASHDALLEEKRESVPKEMRSFGLLNVAWASLMRLLTSMQLSVQKRLIRAELPIQALKHSLQFLDNGLRRFVGDASSYDQGRVQVLRFWLQHMAKLVGCYGSPCVTPCWSQLVATAVDVYAFIKAGGGSNDSTAASRGRVCKDLTDSVAPKLLAALIMGLESSLVGSLQGGDQEAELEGGREQTGAVSIEDKLSALCLSPPKREPDEGPVKPPNSACPTTSSHVAVHHGTVHLVLALLERSPLMGAASLVAVARHMLPWVLSAVSVDMYSLSVSSYSEPDSLAAQAKHACMSLVAASAAAAEAGAALEYDGDVDGGGSASAMEECQRQLYQLAISEHPVLRQLSTDVLCCCIAHGEAEYAVQQMYAVGSLIVQVTAAEAALHAASVLAADSGMAVGDGVMAVGDSVMAVGDGVTAVGDSSNWDQGGNMEARTGTHAASTASSLSSLSGRLAKLLHRMASASPPGAASAAYSALGLRCGPRHPSMAGEPGNNMWDSNSTTNNNNSNRGEGEAAPMCEHLTSTAAAAVLWSSFTDAVFVSPTASASASAAHSSTTSASETHAKAAVVSDISARLDLLLKRGRLLAGMVSGSKADMRAGGGDGGWDVSDCYPSAPSSSPPSSSSLAVSEQASLAAVHLVSVCRCLDVSVLQCCMLLKMDPGATGLLACCEAGLQFSHEVLVATCTSVLSTALAARSSASPHIHLLLPTLRTLTSGVDVLSPSLVAALSPLLTQLLQVCVRSDNLGVLAAEILAHIGALATRMNQVDPAPTELFHALLHHPHWAVAHASLTSLVNVSRSTPGDFRCLIPADVYDFGLPADGSVHPFVALMKAYMGRTPLQGEMEAYASCAPAALCEDAAVLRRLAQSQHCSSGSGSGVTMVLKEGSRLGDCRGTSAAAVQEGIAALQRASLALGANDGASCHAAATAFLDGPPQGHHAAALIEGPQQSDHVAAMLDGPPQGHHTGGCSSYTGSKPVALLSQLVLKNNGGLASLAKAIAGLEAELGALQGAARAGGLLCSAADVAALNSHTSHLLGELASSVSKLRSLQDRVHTLKP